MILRFSEGLLREIRERQIDIAKTVTSGACLTFEHYKHLVGRLDGLKEAEEIVKEIHKRIYQTEVLSKEDIDEREIQFY